MQNPNGYKPAMRGTYTPPADLGPAIEGLSEIGRAWLDGRTYGREIQPGDVSFAAEYERGTLK